MFQKEAGEAIDFRPARAGDATEIARLMIMAGGGVYEFLLDGLFGGLSVSDLLVPGIAAERGPYSYHQCNVAEVGGTVVAVAHAYPIDWMREDDRAFLPPDRLAHLESFDATQDWGSFFLSALAVDPDHRGRGIASRLLARTETRAAADGFDRLTLHVWADNQPARRLYAHAGFEVVAVAGIPWHRRLPHFGGTILMRKMVSP